MKRTKKYEKNLDTSPSPAESSRDRCSSTLCLTSTAWAVHLIVFSGGLFLCAVAFPQYLSQAWEFGMKTSSTFSWDGEMVKEIADLSQAKSVLKWRRIKIAQSFIRKLKNSEISILKLFFPVSPLITSFIPSGDVPGFLFLKRLGILITLPSISRFSCSKRLRSY